MGILRRVAYLVLTMQSMHATAGSEQSGEHHYSPKEIAQFAKKVERYSAAHQAHVFIIARVGQPSNTLPKGVEFTHVALAVYSQITMQNGETKLGYAIHNLYQQADNPEISELIIDYPTDFFWSVQDLKAGIAIPTINVQKQILEAINNGVAKQVHNPKYSLIANPYNNKRQNCTEHTLNVINAALYKTTDMKQIKANTKAYFQAQPLSISRFKLFFGSIFKDDIYKKDHSGDVRIATFTSIRNYLKQYNLLAHSAVLTPDTPINTLKEK
ncbi:DUF2145 domain-containing protein [Pseudoalteromonas luteoviolacea]|uniref:DUF2145 domain-containing protein n=1 Tax=Pseudoalteromonas luteoviolacea S4054 TaxID=1129367 RepID=A0A0F6A9D3_9GAMM|nr:DUF2145 domain-containing protein [Pseudoalteromonas luteoviolacea]AOT11159.1 hypothetical protein S4054249_25355 [Pseudoalteromonas luteoviolacea]AOT15677.1 hypothetical protein S40542_23155 [Pseudoalteromonas luteoviolacea]AOT20980.1 hypothetical protein S4054_25275 [Pseudoalteromonas luteoviolacea]KKE82451.1 hypothetical protein N479_18430 [Pseudoalteromonas luteoviolacea S4054]KZN67407.1 hypothetical protein N481_02340 [Pseudoalteromonas luteoviolacea S4047-1]